MSVRYVHPDYPIRPEQLPLLMFHGYGSNEADLFMLASELPDRYYPVSLRAPMETPFGGYAWFPLQVDQNGDITAKPQDAIRALDDLYKRVVDLLNQWGREQAALLGFSQGGMMAYMLMDTAPERFPLIAALSTYLPESYTIKENQGILPEIFISHGLYDDVIPVEKAGKTLERLRKAGYDPEYHEYPSGHFLSEQNIIDLSDWLMQKAGR